MKGFTIAEQGHVVYLTPVAGTVTAVATSDVLCMKGWAHATILALSGIGSATSTIKVYCVDSFTGTSDSALTFRYAKEDTPAGDTLDAALALASTATLGSSSSYVVIEVDADQLTDGKPYLQVVQGAASAGQHRGLVAILSGGRYQEDITATAIA